MTGAQKIILPEDTDDRSLETSYSSVSRDEFCFTKFGGVKWKDI